MTGEQPNEEQLREQIEEQIKQLKVQDVLLQTVVTLVNLSGRRLMMEEEKDLEQAKLGIDAARVLLPLLPEEESGPVKDALSQLQMAYVRETKAREEAPPEQEAPPKKPDSRIWTPPGTT
jgi:hypothetical protein